MFQAGSAPHYGRDILNQYFAAPVVRDESETESGPGPGPRQATGQRKGQFMREMW